MSEETSLTVSPPSALLVELTSVCNLHCCMCPLPIRQTASGVRPGHMSDETWKEVVAFARRAGHVTVGGYGEPLANPRCTEYLQELDAAGVMMHLTTNGTLLTTGIARELASLRHLTAVNVSIDSPNPDVYREIRGGNVQRALDGVARLAAEIHQSKVVVSSVMMQSTIDTLPAFPAQLARMNVRKYVLQGLIDYRQGLDEEELRWRNGLPARIDAIRRACDEAGVELLCELPDRVATELRDPHGQAVGPCAEPATDETKQCTAPWEVPVIDKDGRVFPCCYALSNQTEILGDLTREGGQAVWTGEKYGQFRRALLRGHTTPAVCRGCTVVPSGRHPFSAYAAQIVFADSLLAGGGPMRLAVRNVGTACWTKQDQIKIGTAGPRDRASAYYHPSWMGANRITSFSEESVPPGAIATFRFDIAPPAGVPPEHFQLLAEHRCWLPDTRFCIRPGSPRRRAQPSPGLSRTALDLVRRMLGRGGHT